MLGFIIWMLIVGAIAGYVARLLVPGRDPMGVLATIGLGIAGSFVGGFLGYLLFDKDLNEGALQVSGVIGSIIGAVIALLIYNAVTSRRPRRRRRSGVF
ncbi:MAG TPA: GlsB/YeaQ/YmgE family stress response membrane protein [Acidimicrobiales bacterium]|nr:GlsB/YeaQ/YmgE family stress response membrane protein [Acidimicrobiales bacterium]